MVEVERGTIEYTRDRLIEWAQFVRFSFGGGLFNIWDALIKYKGEIIRGQGAYRLPVNEQAEEVERIVTKMPERLRIVLCAHYFSRMPARKKAKRLHISTRTFYEDVGKAETWVQAKLS